MSHLRKVTHVVTYMKKNYECRNLFYREQKDTYVVTYFAKSRKLRMS